MTSNNTLTVTDAELMPCPFCGSDATLRDPDHVWAVPFGECNHCGANCPEDAWNTRTPASPTSDDVERVARALRLCRVKRNLWSNSPAPDPSLFRLLPNELDDARAAIAALAAQPKGGG